jgi:threonine/homoserine/homoserine lactone efflux protein
MTVFALAVLLLIITPGPGVLTTAGVGAAFGYRAGIIYVFGLFIGTNLVALAVITGVAATVLAVPGLRAILLWASAAYLLFLAARIALSGTKIAFIGASKPPGIVGGLLLQAINPKAYVVNTTLFSGFVIWPSALGLELAVKYVIANAIWIPLHLAWLAAGVSLHRLNLAARTQRAINILMAVAMLAVVALAVWRQL